MNESLDNNPNADILSNSMNLDIQFTGFMFAPVTCCAWIFSKNEQKEEPKKIWHCFNAYETFDMEEINN